MTRVFAKRYFIPVLAAAMLCALTLTARAEVKKWLRDEITELNSELAKDNSNVELLMKLAERYGWAKMPEDAIATYERVLEVDPGNLDAMRKLRDFYSWNHMPDKALAVMEKMIAVEPDNVEVKKEMAKRYAWAKDQKRAMELYEDVVEARPDDVDARKSLSNLYRWNKMQGKAIEQYAEIVNLDKDDIETKERLAFAYSWSDRPQKAIELFEELLEQDPGNHKARKQLAHLYYYNNRPAGAIEQYKELLDAGVFPEGQAKADVYGKLGNASERIKNYSQAMDYYKEVLNIVPDSVQAQEWVQQVERAISPQIFTEFIFRKTKGSARRLYQRYGFSTILDDGYSMEASYRHLRRTEEGEQRLVTQAGDVMISRDFGGGLNFFAGASMLYYGADERVRFEYFTRLIKKLTERVSGILHYRKTVEDSDYDKLHQNVDRHRLSAGLDCDITKHIVINTALWGDYLTKGNAPDNNMGWGMSVSPTLKMLLDPQLNFSYTYFRAEYLRKDNTGDTRSFGSGVFDYFNPRLYYFHAGTIYFSQEIIPEKVRVTFSDRIYFAQDEDDVNYWGNMIYAEIRGYLTDSDHVTVGYNRSNIFWHVPDSYQIDERVILRYSHDF